MKYPPTVAEFEAMVLANAAYYTTVVFSKKSYQREEHATLGQAKSRARERQKEITNGRKVMLYAVTAEGRSVMVDWEKRAQKGTA